ncbi:hypothetical protein C8F04DRAFT_1123824 [Mycena alexandri]|uniref:F-box domain-containing protein n=1 Tax=Mycena alexandri TaxID=1745969 RepID=A0AAD6WW89_9AGAR|nr:hypothetical protein C8F04DRAFT_1123824 [Mycena alexandri]
MPESIPELEALVGKLSADIELQKDVLKQLERSKSAAQRARTPPLLLLNICNSWTDIALYTPALWSSIYLDFPGVQVLQSWLERARNHALTISLTRSLNRNIGAILKHLEIYDDDLKLGSLIAIGSFPCLETLTIGCLPDDEEDLNDFSLAQILGLLKCLAPNLVECTFHNISTYFDHTTLEVLMLPHSRIPQPIYSPTSVVSKYSSFLPLTSRPIQSSSASSPSAARKILKPSSEVRDGLRQLAAGGMEIYIGSEGQNLMSF